MVRTWLLRGGAAVALAVLVGAWTVGLTGLGDAGSPKDQSGDPAPSDSATVSDVQSSVTVEKARPRRSPGPSPSDAADAADAESGPVTVVDAANEASQPPDTRSAAPTPAPPVRSPRPSKSAKPSKPGQPSRSPTPTPGQPADQCTHLATVVDCLLAPVTRRP